jgi:hypothetical protein
VLGNKTSLVVRSRDEKTFTKWLENEYELTKENLGKTLQYMADTLKKVAAKKKEEPVATYSENQQEQLTGYQKEMLSMKQVFESVGLPTSALETTETPRKQPDSTISVTFLNRSKSIKK